MAKIKQGSVRWATLPPPAGRRPLLVLTRSDAIGWLSNVTVAPLTRTVRGIASEVPLSPEADGVPTVCAVSLDNILTVRKAILEQQIVALADARMQQVFDAIRFAFAMPT